MRVGGDVNAGAGADVLEDVHVLAGEPEVPRLQGAPRFLGTKLLDSARVREEEESTRVISGGF